MIRLTLILMLVMATAVAAEPVLVAPAYRFDYGAIPNGTQVQHHFWLKSIGTDTVQIGDVKTGCSCAVSSLDTKIIPPGDSVLLGVKWDTKRFRGSLARAIRVFYNDKPNPLILQMTGQVYDNPALARPVSAKPFRIEFGRTSNIDIDSVALTLINHSDEELGISLISFVPEECEISLPTEIEPNSEARGYVKLRPEYADKEFRTSFTILSSDRENTHLTIAVRRKFY